MENTDKYNAVVEVVMGSAAEEKNGWSEDEADTLLSLVGTAWRVDENNVTNNGFPASEANAVIQNFNALSASDKQAILDFLRSL